MRITDGVDFTVCSWYGRLCVTTGGILLAGEYSLRITGGGVRYVVGVDESVTRFRVIFFVM